MIWVIKATNKLYRTILNSLRKLIRKGDGDVFSRVDLSTIYTYIATAGCTQREKQSAFSSSN